MIVPLFYFGVMVWVKMYVHFYLWICDELWILIYCYHSYKTSLLTITQWWGVSLIAEVSQQNQEWEKERNQNGTQDAIMNDL